MKLITAALLAALAAPSIASPYFRPLDISHPQVSAGAIWSTSQLNQSVGVTDLAIITHSPADGSIIPGSWRSVMPPEDWVPLQLGAGGSFTGNAVINAGTSLNVAPQVAALVLRGVSASSSPWLVAVKSAFTGASKTGLSFAAGPTWYAAPVVNGTMLPVDKWQGRFGIFTGAAWKF